MCLQGHHRLYHCEMKSLGIYVHVPFCVRRCPYCGFYSTACGRSGCEDVISEYFSLLSEELAARAEDIRAPYSVDSIYFGGGTPSLAGPELISGLIDHIAKLFDLSSDCEISMEANPGTLTADRLKAYRGSGVNRLSIGLQSFDDDVLKTLGRIHTASDFIRSYGEARTAGFDNISADLMFGVPGQTLSVWTDTVMKLASMLPEHISFYSLQIEEGTPFYDEYKLGGMVPVSDEEDREMYHSALQILRDHGYSQYEISSASLPGCECRHNLKYWTFCDYMGIGASASSFMDGVRKTDPSDGYGDFVRSGLPDDGLAECHMNSDFDNAADYMITGLRLNRGIDEDDFRMRFGKTLWEMFPDAAAGLKDFFDKGAVMEQDHRLFITEKGFDISNRIMECFV